MRRRERRRRKRRRKRKSRSCWTSTTYLRHLRLLEHLQSFAHPSAASLPLLLPFSLSLSSQPPLLCLFLSRPLSHSLPPPLCSLLTSSFPEEEKEEDLTRSPLPSSHLSITLAYDRGCRMSVLLLLLLLLLSLTLSASSKAAIKTDLWMKAYNEE